MAKPAGAQSPVDLAIVNGTLYFLSPNGTWTSTGGGSGTVNVGSNLTGDGSIGTPINLNTTNSTIMASLASDWAQQEIDAAKTLLPAITSWKRIPMPLPITTGAVAPTGDANVEGAGYTTTQNVHGTVIGNSVFQTPKTGKWWLAGKVALKGGGASGHNSYFAAGNIGGSHWWAISRFNATSSTKYTLQLIGTSTVNQAGILAADNNQHTFRLFFDGTTAFCYIDGTLDSQQATIAQMADEPLYVTVYSDTNGEVAVADLLIGFIG